MDKRYKLIPKETIGRALKDLDHLGPGLTSNASEHPAQTTSEFKLHNIGALIFGIGFWGPLYCTYNKDPPK